MSLSLVYSLLLAGVGVLFTEPLLRLLGLSEEVIALGAGYMRIQFVGQAAIGFQGLTASRPGLWQTL